MVFFLDKLFQINILDELGVLSIFEKWNEWINCLSRHFFFLCIYRESREFEVLTAGLGDKIIYQSFHSNGTFMIDTSTR